MPFRSLLPQQVAQGFCSLSTALGCVLPLFAHGLVLWGMYVVLEPYFIALSILWPYFELVLKGMLF